jgi:hypothetical protein
MPQQCQPGEQMTLIYKILPPSTFDKTIEVSEVSRTLTISLSSTVLISEDCTPKVKLKWKTALELPPSRPSSRSGRASTPPTEPLLSIGHDALTMTGEVAEVESTPTISSAVSLTISAPDKVYAEEVFQWEVLVVNRSESMQRFALLPVPKRRLNDSYAHVRRPSSSGSYGVKPGSQLANPVADDNVLYSMQKSGTMESTDLICLTPDVRIG